MIIDLRDMSGADYDGLKILVININLSILIIVKIIQV